jgi:hypothetical protein
MKANQLRLDCDEDGETCVSLWCDLRTPDDVVDIIEWLKLARTLMEKWKAIRCVEEQA